MDSFLGVGDNSVKVIGENSLINSFWKLAKYVKRAVPCEKFDHFFYFFLYIY